MCDLYRSRLIGINTELFLAVAVMLFWKLLDLNKVSTLTLDSSFDTPYLQNQSTHPAFSDIRSRIWKNARHRRSYPLVLLGDEG